MSTHVAILKYYSTRFTKFNFLLTLWNEDSLALWACGPVILLFPKSESFHGAKKHKKVCLEYCLTKTQFKYIIKFSKSFGHFGSYYKSYSDITRHTVCVNSFIVTWQQAFFTTRASGSKKNQNLLTGFYCHAISTHTSMTNTDCWALRVPIFHQVRKYNGVLLSQSYISLFKRDTPYLGHADYCVFKMWFGTLPISCYFKSCLW